jgi:hypothetical protein
MEIMLLVNRKIENMIGNSILMLKYLDMEKRELKMVLLWLFIVRGMKINSLKQ